MSKASLELGGGNWGTKDGNLLAYAQGNESSNLVPREFTFTRGSDIAATRVNSSGLIEKYRENLLLQSNQFDNTTWIGRSQTTLTGGQIGYDGSNDAWSCATTSGGQIMGQNIVNQGVQTISVYAKGSVSNGLRIFAFGNDNVDFWVNLNTGLPDGGISSKVIDYNIEDVNGDGEWYRCSFTFSQTTSSIYFYCTDNNRSNAAGTIYIQDAQLEQGLVATSYLESGATTAKAGVLDNLPRIDYTGGTASLLLEPSRTNLIPYSEYFDEWGHYGNATAQLANVLSPEGKLNAYEFTFDGTTNGRIQDTIPVTDGNTYTFSVYLKNKNISTPTQVWIGFSNPSSQGEYVTVTNEWQRFETTQVANSGSSEYPRVLCNGVGSIYGYGAQLEEGSYPTSYIPTYGTSDTRNGEDISINTLDQIYSTDITIFLEVERLVSTSDLNKEIGIVINSTTSPNNRFTFYSTSNGRLRVLITDNSGNTDNLYSANNAFDKGETIKVALKITNSGCTLFIDGSSVDTSSGIGEILGLDRISFIRDSIIKQFLIFPTALSDREAVDLTSPYSTYQELVTAEGLTWESPTCTTNSITELQSI